MSVVAYKNRQTHRLQSDLDALELVGPLPFINGTWFFVDPTSGNNSRTGRSVAEAVADLPTAYGLCTSGAGDGIVLLSRGTSSAGTTSYLDTSLAWTKHGITVVGRAAPTRMAQRARVANKERTTGAITTISFEADDGTYYIHDSASGFVTAGFEAGQTIEVDTTSGANDGAYTITAVAAGTLTVAEEVTDEDAASAQSTTIKSYQAQLLNISGDNNVFVNMHVGNFGSSQYAVGAVLISGNRNAFINCHLYGAGHATPAATTGAYDLELDSAEENSFYGCVFGSDTIIRAAANANIRFDGGCWRNVFEGCEIRSHSATAGKGAIMSVDATAFSGIQVFRDCRFLNWNPNGISALTSAFIGTKPTSGAILIDSCTVVGWAAWDSVGGNDMVYVANSDATASGAGGIATTP